jgi:hypothetical protein
MNLATILARDSLDSIPFRTKCRIARLSLLMWEWDMVWKWLLISRGLGNTGQNAAGLRLYITMTSGNIGTVVAFGLFCLTWTGFLSDTSQSLCSSALSYEDSICTMLKMRFDI